MAVGVARRGRRRTRRTALQNGSSPSSTAGLRGSRFQRFAFPISPRLAHCLLGGEVWNARPYGQRQTQWQCDSPDAADGRRGLQNGSTPSSLPRFAFPYLATALLEVEPRPWRASRQRGGSVTRTAGMVRSGTGYGRRCLAGFASISPRGALWRAFQGGPWSLSLPALAPSADSRNRASGCRLEVDEALQAAVDAAGRLERQACFAKVGKWNPALLERQA